MWNTHKYDYTYLNKGKGLLALGFKPSRFFLKGKVRQNINNIHIHKHKSKKKLVRREMNTKEEDIKITNEWYIYLHNKDTVSQSLPQPGGMTQ